MIFKPELVEKILAGEKTQTRRLVSDNPRSPWSKDGCLYQSGNEYAVQPGRGQTAVARILVEEVRGMYLDAVTEDDAHAEGFPTRADFVRYWEKMHGSFDERALVWAITFVVV